MTNSSLQHQIDVHRFAVTFGLARNFHHWLVGIAAGLVLLAMILWNPVPLMIALFLGVVGLSERQAGPNIEAAIKAYDTSDPSVGEVFITKECWDTDDHYYALVSEPGQPDWEYEFVPQGWQPAVGFHSARIWRIGAKGPPVLTATEHGILIPRYIPSRPKPGMERCLIDRRKQ